MTDSDAPKPDQAKSKTSTSDTGDTKQGSQSRPTKSDEPQVALDVMAALCREFGLTGLPSDASDNLVSPTSQSRMQDAPTETAFEIIQRFLFDGESKSCAGGAGSTAHTAPTPNFNDSIPDPANIIARATGLNFLSAPDKSEASTMSNLNSETSETSTEGTTAQWGLRTSHRDGSTTELSGPVIKDDMFRTAMPCLQGTATADADTPDWAIKMTQGLPLSPGRTNAQSAIGAKLSAADIPATLSKWRVDVGPSPDAQCQLSVSLPTSAPSQLRALLCDTTATDDSSPQLSDVPSYGGGPFALHLEQSIGSTSSEAVPNLALIRLVFADRAPIPAQLEYIGTLPSPIIGGAIMVAPNYSIPFRAQITPPSDGDKGAGLVILVQYNQETSFNVTAQLLTETKTTTPTAILSCVAQGDNAACRAASMVANASGRLETSLTGLAEIPDDAGLAPYGFILPPEPADAATDAKPQSGSTATGTADQDASSEDAAADPTKGSDTSAPAPSKASGASSKASSTASASKPAKGAASTKGDA
ncbi:hypothetical protein [Thalassospira sp.]|uniref:hypothetical protein n=1 Tax=Thalassospira sp. TaxID=1912094 RepID=UPI0032EFE7AB